MAARLTPPNVGCLTPAAAPATTPCCTTPTHSLSLPLPLSSLLPPRPPEPMTTLLTLSRHTRRDTHTRHPRPHTPGTTAHGARPASRRSLPRDNSATLSSVSPAGRAGWGLSFRWLGAIVALSSQHQFLSLELLFSLSFSLSRRAGRGCARLCSATCSRQTGDSAVARPSLGWPPTPRPARPANQRPCSCPAPPRPPHADSTHSATATSTHTR